MTENAMTETAMTETATPDALAGRRLRGRPSLYSDELAEEICDRIAEGKSLRKICDQPDMPDKSTVMRWLNRHDEFRDRYRKARELLVDHLADEMINIADAAMLAKDRLELDRLKLRIDVRKWLITHLAARKHAEPGEKKQINPVVPESDMAV